MRAGDSRGVTTVRSGDWRAPAIDVEGLRREDSIRRGRPGHPIRVGHPFAVALSPRSSGTWSEDDGGRRWVLTLSSPGALWLVVGLERFDLPQAAHLFIRGGAEVLGPYSAADVRAHGQLWSPPLAGDTLTLELVWPASLGDSEPDLRIGTLAHGYEPWGGTGREAQFQNTSADCHVDVACATENVWNDARRGVVQLLSGGFAFCSGSLVNNGAEDCRPYVLTAAHCQAGASTSFRFNYERDSCGGGTAAEDQILTGATVVASWGTSDFTLLELDHAPPKSFDVYYNGWRRSSGLIPSSAVIHHPQGDVKKISTNDDWLTDGLYWGGSHWRVQHWESGATQGGSSGAPLFDGLGRIVGQLHGGTVSCESDGWDEFGKLAFSFVGNGTPGGRLSDWLDPDGSGINFLPGLDASACLAPIAQLELADVVIADVEGGNGNGRIDPGESVLIDLRLTNAGDAVADGIVGVLSSPNDTLIWSEASASWPPIAPESTSWNITPAPRLQLPADWDCSLPVPLQLELSEGGGSTASATWSIPVGNHGRSLLVDTDVEIAGAPWSTATVVGSGGWEISNARSYTGSFSWFVADASSAHESHLMLQPFVPDADDYKLRFRHYLESEFEYDGGVLEFRIGAAGWSDASSRFLAGGYNSQLEPTLASSLSERMAWSGALGEWREVVVDLSGLQGLPVEFRWRFASDASTGGDGWYIDDLEVWRDTLDCDPWSATPLPELGGLRLSRAESSLQFTWDAPGSALGFVRLYRRPIDSHDGAWLCEEAIAGDGAATLPLPSGSSAYLVGLESTGVAGSLGLASDGSARAPGSCP